MDMARLTPQPKKMEDRRWKMAKAASACVSALWNDLRGKCGRKIKLFGIVIRMTRMGQGGGAGGQ